MPSRATARATANRGNWPSATAPSPCGGRGAWPRRAARPYSGSARLLHASLRDHRSLAIGPSQFGGAVLELLRQRLQHPKERDFKIRPLLLLANDELSSIQTERGEVSELQQRNCRRRAKQ